MGTTFAFSCNVFDLSVGALATLGAAFSLRLSGHPQFVRPLISPMAHGAAVVKYGAVDEETEDEIKGYCAASDNFGNFYAQLCFMGAAGTMLIVSTLTEQGCELDALRVSLCAIPIALISIVVGAAHNYLLDKRLDKKHSASGPEA